MKRVLLRSIRFYRARLTHRKRTPTCRFVPSCSQYAETAIERYGAVYGGQLAMRRILRCNPLCRGGYDPVPEDPLISVRRE
ncbi:MAG: membrane protein insertion efficiency factor YidD [Clostridia bacterium]|nr:membrane protein insertion efficiency factor YidD [Clostridia bacterium]MBR2287722.1 membrane protein insertion efficiency factor YidD [Clostridia bacterium]